MLLDAILKAIHELEAMDKCPAEVERVLQNLKDTVRARTKESLIDVLSVGEKRGCDAIKQQLNDLLGFIDAVDEKRRKC